MRPNVTTNMETSTRCTGASLILGRRWCSVHGNKFKRALVEAFGHRPKTASRKYCRHGDTVVVERIQIEVAVAKS